MYKNYSPPKEISHDTIYIVLYPFISSRELNTSGCFLFFKKKLKRGEVEEIQELLEILKWMSCSEEMRVFISLESFFVKNL